jgi:hypothetical protein
VLVLDHSLVQRSLFRSREAFALSDIRRSPFRWLDIVHSKAKTPMVSPPLKLVVRLSLAQRYFGKQGTDEMNAAPLSPPSLSTSAVGLFCQ